MTAAFTVADEAVQVIERGPDLELRVRRVVLTEGGEEFLDIREYVPSSETYGRGVMVPAELQKRLVAALKGA